MKELKVPISESFNSIQGEGLYAGLPVRFIRVSGCTRNCTYCDSSYHQYGKKQSMEELAEEISGQRLNTIVVTGGEPLLYFKELSYLHEILSHHSQRRFSLHVETNGDLIHRLKVDVKDVFSVFDYAAVSPKTVEVAKSLSKMLVGPMSNGKCDIKVVTDLSSVGKNFIKYATMLMPLTTYNEKRDINIRKKVWDYCVDNKIKYSPRLHVDLFGKSRGV